MSLLSGVREWFLRLVGYLIPLVQSLPPLGVWTTLMTLPFATYLVMMFTNLPVNLPKALSEFLTPFLIIEKALLIIGVVILAYSIVHLETGKKGGLVTSGPYRLVRHPQYFGITLSTLGLTSWSVWILNNTFGMGFLNPLQTIGVWLVQLLAYALLASIEELYLTKTYGEAFEDYRRQVPFLVPFFNTKRILQDVVLSISILSLLLFILVSMHTI